MSVFWIMERPVTTTLRPLAMAASQICCMRWMWLANDAMITRPVAWLMMLASTLPTSASESVKFGFVAFVESLIMRSTPIFEKRASAPKSVWTPSMGLWSSLKSPVWSTLPAGLWKKTPTAPGMEWFTAKNSAVMQPSLTCWPGLISMSLAFFTRCSASLPSMRPSVSLVA